MAETIDKTKARNRISLASFGDGMNAVVIGASGGIGRAFVAALETCDTTGQLFALARTVRTIDSDVATRLTLDLENEESIARAAAAIADDVGLLHLVIVATGILHDGSSLRPERTWGAVTADQLERAFRVNAVGPALVAKHFLPLLATDRKAVFAALSARVGSIGDNRLGGWHAYRASKAALNMLIRTNAIELARRNPSALCVGLHPGTVDTALSEPFQKSARDGKLFSPSYSAAALLSVLDGLAPEGSGFVYAWDGERLPF